MEQTLEEMLYDLQCYKTPALYFCKLEGNRLGKKQWRIRMLETIGGEKFCFNQVSDYNMGEGGGIYFDSIAETVEYARGIAKEFLNKKRPPLADKLMGDRFAYDWFKHEYEEV